MYRIRFHGRGGQGMKTASRMLGTAFFLEGFEVQDAPRYGAERRGAPIFAYVRASHGAIHERGIIRRPDLVVVVDDGLLTVPAAGVLAGAGERTVVLVQSDVAREIWCERLEWKGLLLTLPLKRDAVNPLRLLGTGCAGAAARLVGVIARSSLEEAIHEELGGMSQAIIERNLEVALASFERMEPHAGCVKEADAVPLARYQQPEWIDLPFETARVAAPSIHAAVTSGQVKTGLWRTTRPVIDYSRCHQCSWLCGGFCPDSAITVDANGFPHIDYEHCKGCMICVSQCPHHAVSAVSEKGITVHEQEKGAEGEEA